MFHIQLILTSISNNSYHFKIVGFYLVIIMNDIR